MGPRVSNWLKPYRKVDPRRNCPTLMVCCPSGSAPPIQHKTAGRAADRTAAEYSNASDPERLLETACNVRPA